MQSKHLLPERHVPRSSTVGKKSPLHTRTQVYKLVHMHSYPQVHKDVLPQMPLCKYACIHTYARTHTCAYRYAYSRTCTRVHAHVCIHCFAGVLTLKKNKIEPGGCQGVIYFNY